jgi:hypothetical protein
VGWTVLVIQFQKLFVIIIMVATIKEGGAYGTGTESTASSECDDNRRITISSCSEGERHGDM